MLTGGARRLVLIALAIGLLALLWRWLDEPFRDRDAVRRGSAGGTQNAPANRADSASGSAGDRVASTGARTNSRDGSDSPGKAPARLQIVAPSEARVGDVFQVRIEVEAKAALSQLMFAVSYDKSRLTLAGWSEGSLAQRGGSPADLGVEEPSDGNIQVIFKASNGLSVAGAGSLAVLQFEASKPGTSEIKLQNLSAVDWAGAGSDIVVLQEGLVTIR